MKRIVLSIMFVAVALVSNAQTWAGASVGLSVMSQENERTITEFSFAPMMRFGITDKLSAGCELALQTTFQGGESIKTIGVAPFLRYDCLSLGNNRFFLHAGFAYASSDISQFRSNMSTIGVGINPGLAIPLTEVAELELGIGGLSWSQAKLEGVKTSAVSVDILSNITIGISLRL